MPSPLGALVGVGGELICSLEGRPLEALGGGERLICPFRAGPRKAPQRKAASTARIGCTKKTPIMPHAFNKLFLFIKTVFNPISNNANNDNNHKAKYPVSEQPPNSKTITACKKNNNLGICDTTFIELTRQNMLPVQKWRNLLFLAPMY